MKFGLIGYPIEHSLSPALFKAGYNGRYSYDLIQTDKFDEAYSMFIENYDGINVTAPFKELALDKAEVISEECRMIGATNLLVKAPEGITAYNSDYRGLCLWLKGKAIRQTSHALIVGMGGAGKAAATAAWTTGLRLTLMNRDIVKAQEMAKRLGGKSADQEIEIRPLDDFCECFRKADIIIYNLPVRLQELDLLTHDDFLSSSETPSKYVLEANYRNPSFDSALLSRMTAANPKAEYTAGQAWLLLQALTGYELFTGESPDLSKMAEQI